MSSEVEGYIRKNVSWQKLPSSVKQSLGNSSKEYERVVVNFSIKNQLRYRGNLVRHFRKEEQRYYEDLLTYSRTSLLLYPYHLSDIIVKGLRVTPFQYYTKVLELIMENERSYDSLPNFTAADCLRLLGIGRNEYIDLMNQCRSGRKLFRKKNVKDLLPSKPVDIHIEPWWVVEVGCIIEDDIKIVSQAEKELIDHLIDFGFQRAGDLDNNLVHSLYKKGLIYLEVPIDSSDHIVVPPLEGFVMNRVLGDYFETLLYKIFVSIDEHTSVGELAQVLQIELEAVKQAVSLYCRLGFARRKIPDTEQWHPTWNPALSKMIISPSADSMPTFSKVYSDLASTTDEESDSTNIRINRIAFLFDSTLTAFLMMGNLSPGLKSHAVTMFEVGKLTDESMDNFLCELEKVSAAMDESEGEARRYFEHALVLRSTILTLRQKGSLDLVRCESLHSLEKDTCTRLLSKNYSLLVSMTPLSGEVMPIVSNKPPHLGPPSPHVHTPWFKLFLYHLTGSGPPSLLLARGTRLRRLPKMLAASSKVLVTSWGHDPTLVPTSNLLFTLNDALCYAPVLTQVYASEANGSDTHLVPFPFSDTCEKDVSNNGWEEHPGIRKLSRELDLDHACGYVTMVAVRSPVGSDAADERPGLESRPMAKRQDSLTLFLKPHEDEHLLDTPVTPSCVEAWIQSMSTGVGDLNIKHYSPVKEEPEPVNGITSVECAEILEQELDRLVDNYNSPSRSDPGEIGEEEKGDITVNLQLHVGMERRTSCSPLNLAEWSILDCSFGIPLFDAEVNQIVTSSVVNRLCHPDSLEKLIESNTNLAVKLSDFIKRVQEWGEEETGTLFSSNATVWPVTNLAFMNGQLKPWDGK